MIEVEGLSKRFGKTQAVAGLSFRVEPGTITGFLGPNGAGKSTTLRSVLGLVHPDAGSATVLGVPYRRLDRPLSRVGAVLEASEVHPGRSGRNHLRVQAAAAGLPASRVDEVLALVELSAAAKRRVKGYSLGMRQRLGLATALLGDPEVLVLDEPANGLDPAGIRWLRDLLRSLAAEGRTVLVSSHVLSEVAQTVDRVVIIHRGRLIQQAAIADVLAGAQGATRVRHPGRAAVARAADGAGRHRLRQRGRRAARERAPRARRRAHGRERDRPARARRRARDARGGLPRTDGWGDDRMTAVVRSELLKIRTTRGWWAYLVVLVALVGIGAAAEVGSRSLDERSGLDFQYALVDLIGISSLLAIILGITIVTTEFRHGTITPTLLATPGRERVLAGKAIAGVLIAILFAAMAIIVVLVVASIYTSIDGGQLELADGEVVKRAATNVLGVVLWLLMGLAIGSVVHSQVAALVGTLVWLFLVETLLVGLFSLLDIDAVQEYLPFRALDGADGTGGDNLLSYGPALAVTLGWIAVLGAAGAVRTSRRDIT